MSDTIQPKTLEQIQHRLEKLTPDTPQLWGKMDATKMLTHLSDVIKVTIGKKEAKDRSKFFPNYFIFLFVVYILPVSMWPRGVRTLPEYKWGDPKEYNQQLEEFKQLLLDFNACDRASIKRHPAWGNLSKRENRDLLVKHIDHHLRQFGI